MEPDDTPLAEALTDRRVSVGYLFGSRIDGSARPTSDLDVAVLVDGGLGLLEQVQLADEIRLVCGVPEVDLVVLDRASLELRAHVVRTGRCIFSRDETRRVGFEVRTLLEYLDFEPTLRRLTDSYLRRVAAG